MNHTSIFVVIFTLLSVSACASDSASRLKSADIQIINSRLVDATYGYSFGVPENWILLDQNTYQKLDHQQQKLLGEVVQNTKLWYRAMMFDQSSRALVIILCTRFGFFHATQEVVRYGDSEFEKMCLHEKNFGSCEIDKFELLTDRNYYAKSPNLDAEVLYYLQAYQHKDSINALYLIFLSSSYFFEDYLPAFLDCVKSLNVRKTPWQIEHSVNVENKLRTLKKFRERGLISEEEYNEKMRHILEDF